MQKSISEYLAETYLEYRSKLESTQKELNNNIDKTSMWLVSLSTGAIVFIFSINNINSNFNVFTIKLAIYLYTIALLCGFFSRFFSFWSIRAYADLNAGFMFRSYIEKFPNKGVDLNGNENAEQIYYLLQESFKIDKPELINQYPQSAIDREEFDKIARDYYNEYKEYNTEETNRATEKFDRILEVSYGYKEGYFSKRRESKGDKPDEFDKIVSRKKRIKAQGYLNIYKLLYIISIINFSAATIFLACSF